MGEQHVKPLLRWPGSKRQLVQQLAARLPKRFDVYHEPFAGGASLFFHMEFKKKLVFLADVNAELINFYKQLRLSFENTARVVRRIERLLALGNSKEAYYTVRAMDRDPDYNKLDHVTKAARFFYLNQTCFNGLSRYNSKQQFNVPYGKEFRYDLDLLFDYSRVLSTVRLAVRDFKASMEYIHRGHFVYMDPPYIQHGNEFNNYWGTFGFNDTVELLTALDDCHKNGAFFMLSNADHPYLREWSQKHGYVCEQVSTKRKIAAKADSRKKVTELIIRNYQ